MARPVISNLDFGGVAKITNLPTPSASGDAVNKAYADGLSGAVVTSAVELDFGSTPLNRKIVDLSVAGVTLTSKIKAWQSGTPATGRASDEAEFVQLHVIAIPGSGTIRFILTVLEGTAVGKYVINYQVL